MMVQRLFAAMAVVLIMAAGTFAQPALAQGVEGPRAETGGAQTLEDILARQRGQSVDNAFRRNALGNGVPPSDFAPQLGTLGAQSDAEVWRSLRFGQAHVVTTARNSGAAVLIQDSGMRWLEFRKGPLATYGSYLLGGMVVALALFFLIRGRIRIKGARTGLTIKRFAGIERFAHWLLGGSFVLLALTGLFQLFGRIAIIPLVGRDAYAPVALAGKWVHNNVSWAFMLGLVMVILFWIAQNIPNRHDLKWVAMAGGMFSKNAHPPARKFNAGQKLIFWAVVVLGLSISASGLSLLFPFELPMFAATFEKINALGLPGLLGYPPLPETLLPHQEMQLAQLWHTIIAFLFIAIILGHIYIGTIGMEGAFEAMGTGEVDLQWAKEHHGLWVEEMTSGSSGTVSTTPAE